MRFGRRRDAEEEQRATALELFYDLVFVFAITQVSHLLLENLTWHGALHAAIALLAVWWAWNYTTWVTNELDPDSAVVRLLLLGLMLGSLLMAVATPEAFGERGLLFAAAYAAPLVLYRVPGRPRLAHTTWTVQTSHFAERFQLFVIIALGESIVITGATTAELELDAARTLAFVVAFMMTAAFWWLYFNYVARVAERRLELSSERTRLARDGYTYLHAVLVAGIVASAVGDELVIAHPLDELPTEELAVVAGGPALYLVGHVLFRLRLAGSVSWKRLGGALACLAAGALGAFLPGLAVASLVTVVLIAVIVSERVAALRRQARGEPSPLDRLQTEG